MGFIKRIADAGYSEKIVIGQDICTKHRLTKYGGHGYGHILENIVPKMRRKGFSEELIHAITVGNPASILAFVYPTAEREEVKIGQPWTQPLDGG